MLINNGRKNKKNKVEMSLVTESFEYEKYVCVIKTEIIFFYSG